MATENVCWGIEMGYGAIKALKLQADGDKLTVLDFAVINHAKVLSTPELDKDDAMRVALGALAAQHDLSNATICVSAPGHQSFARFAKLPPVEPKKVPDIVKFEAVQQIPFSLDEVEWDYQTFANADSPEVEVGIFAITRKRIADILAQAQDVGATPDIATLSPVAVYNAIAYDLEFTESTPGTILLDVGAVATDLIIAEGGRVWVRTFPIGGHQFTEALINTFKLSYSKAEKLKREAEQTKHARHVFQSMRPVFADLVQEVQRSIGFYQSTHPNAELSRLIGLGSTLRLPGLRKYLKQQLQMDVYRLEHFKSLSLEGPRAAEFQDASLNLATAFGLALQGLDRGTLQANLMPVEVIREAMWKKKTGWFAASAGIAAAAAATMFIRPFLDSTTVQGAQKPAVLNSVSKEAVRLAREAEEAGVTNGSGSDLSASHMLDLFDDRDLYTRVLADSTTAIASAGELARQDDLLGVPEGKPPFGLVSVNAFFVPSGEAVEDPTGPSTGPREPARGTGRGARPQRGAAAEGPLGEITAIDKVRVEMTVTTTAEFGELAIKNALVQWLRDHDAPASGAPYRMVLGNKPFVELVQPGGPGQQGRGPIGRPNTRGDGTIDRLAPIEIPEDAGWLPEGDEFLVVWHAVLDVPKGDAS